MFLGIFFSLQNPEAVSKSKSKSKSKSCTMLHSDGNLYIQLVRGLVLGADGEYLLKGIFSKNVVGGYIV